MNSPLLCYTLSAGSFKSRVPAYGAYEAANHSRSDRSACLHASILKSQFWFLTILVLNRREFSPAGFDK